MAVLRSDPGAASGVNTDCSNSGGTLKLLGDTLVRGADFKTGDRWLHRNLLEVGSSERHLGAGEM